MNESMMAFLICSERSGSNLITRMLDAHPDVCGPTPLHLIRIFSRNLFRYGNLENDERWLTLLEDVVAIIATQLGKWRTQWTTNDLVQDVKERRLAAIIDHIYRAERDACGKKHIFIKENRVHTFLPFLFANYPAAKYLYLVRDPRDMALSWKLSKNHPGGVAKAAAIWSEDQRKFLEVMGYLRPQKQILLLRYEDLLQFPEHSAQRIIRFLRIPYREEMFYFYKQDLTVENANRLADWSNLKKPLMKKNFNKYQTALSTIEIRYIETVCREAMRILDYRFDYPHDDLSWTDIKTAVEAMDEKIPSGQASHESTENEIREKRLAVIQRIIRRQDCDFSIRDDHGRFSS